MQTSAEFNQTVNETAQNIGLVLMSAALSLGIVELKHPETKATVNAQPAYAFATDSGAAHHENRKEREERSPHYISYSAVQRTPGRTGML